MTIYDYAFVCGAIFIVLVVSIGAGCITAAYYLTRMLFSKKP